MAFQKMPSSYFEELEEMKKILELTVPSFLKLSQDHYQIGLYAQWHINGLLYHMSLMIEAYNKVSVEVLNRLNTIPHADVLIMHTPQQNAFIYELYSFVNLAKITLDNLRYVLALFLKVI